MQGSSALLVAGTVAIVAGLAGPSLASDNPVESTAPAAEVAEAGGDASSAPPVPVEEAEAPTPAAAEDDIEPGREEPELGVTELGGADPDEKGKRDRGSQRQDEGESAKQPRADAGVQMEDFEFKPKSVTIDPGDEVTWTNRDSAQHNAVGEGAADFDTGLLEEGEDASVPFNDTGTFNYLCTVHPDMKGKVVVRSGSGGGGKSGGSGTGGTSASTTDTTTPTTGSSTGFGSTPSSTSSGGSLPNTGQNELPLLLLGTALIVFGLLARAFREYWIWR